MCWPKRDLWKAGIVIAGMLLLLVLMVRVPVSAAGAYERAPGLAEPGTVTVQATITVDATVAALNKEKLEQEIQQLKYQNEQLKYQNALDFFVWFPGWLRTNAAILLSTLVVVIGGLIGLFRWFGDRRSEREKRAEERFQSVMEGLGSERTEARTSAAVMLRTFLRPGYEEFYLQVFDLTVASLRSQKYASSSSSDESSNRQSQTLLTPGGRIQERAEPNTSQPQNPLSLMLTTVFRESFPRARDRQKRGVLRFDPKSLNAASIQLDQAYLYGADLQEAWMPEASLKGADLKDAKLNPIKLEKANLTGAELNAATLSGADLTRATLTKADLTRAVLSKTSLENATLRSTTLICADLTEAVLTKADLTGANLTEAILVQADLTGASLADVKLTNADLTRADLTEAVLTKADLTGANLTEANPETAASLLGTVMHEVIGLSEEQRKACKDKGASIEYSTQQLAPSSPPDTS